jgi:hypothetical protein
MIWAEKTVLASEGAVVQDQFESIFMQLGTPDTMMLVSTDAKQPGSERLIFCLPDERLLALFGGFEIVAEAALPKTASLVIARQAAYEERFGLAR